MLKNYITIAFRNIIRNKAYSIINILGLSLGVACCMLLTLYIQDEASYDKHHRDVESLYRINSHFSKGLDDIGTCSPPIAMALRDELPEVETAVRVLNPPGVAQNLIKYEDNVFYEPNGYLADSTLFDVFTYEFMEGNPKKALTDANTVVLTKTLAQKLFGNEPALNKLISISQQGPAVNFKVTGVIANNNKSHINANFFLSMSSAGWAEYMRSDNAIDEWAGQNFVPSYVKLTHGADLALVTKKMNDLLIKHGAEDMKALGMVKTLSLEPVKDIYLKSDIGQSPRITYVYIIATIALFIVLIACINFMNLSTARAAKRANEIGVRKVMGAYRSSLVIQLLGEAIIIVLISMIISMVLVEIALPAFNQLTDKTISFNTHNIGYFILTLIGLTLVTGIVAGSYPAFYLSSFEPAQVLKGKSASLSNASGLLRKSLVVFQFMIAITLICGMIIISRQLNFMQHKNLGFDAQSKIVLPLRTENAQKNYDAIKHTLEANANVINVSGADYMPGSFIWSDMFFYADGGNMETGVRHYRNKVDSRYLELLNIKMLAGRTFTENREADSKDKVILNRTSVEKLGFTIDNAVGQKIYFDWQGMKYSFEVIGVMEDYHQTSLKEAIIPILFSMLPPDEFTNFMIVSVQPKQFKEALASIEKSWKSVVNDTPFEYSFLDEDIQKQYNEDHKISQIITTFTIIAMIISCLGLYGLSTYMAERRFKEIGVRKVMGASVNQIVSLMSTEFIKLVCIAFLISVPLAWYGMTLWLEGFAYKVSIDGTVFIIAGVGALTLALLTVSFESVKAASTNPVKSLRNE